MSKNSIDVKKFLEMQSIFRSSSRLDIESVVNDLSKNDSERSIIMSEEDIKYFVLLDDILSDDIDSSISMFSKYKN